MFETNKHMLNNSKHVFLVCLIINLYTYYYHTYKEVLLSGKPNVPYMIHFRNFLKGGTEIFYFFNIDTYVDSIFKRNNFGCNISMLGLGLSWVNTKFWITNNKMFIKKALLVTFISSFLQL